MSETYEPGTPADIYYADTKVRGLRVPGGWSLETDWASFLRDEDVTDVRPLVVLDLEDPRRTFADLSSACLATGNSAVSRRLLALRDQIEAQTKPPKPAEPTALGAVVEDSKGRLWTNTGKDMPNRWACATDFGWVDYPEIDAVRVLSQGVNADDD